MQRPACDVRYAAPEVVAEMGREPQAAPVLAAPDVWAVGCIAWELLTGAPVFAPGTSVQDVQAAFSAPESLPWQRRDTRETHVPRLRILQRSVLACLQLDPAARPASRELLGAWNGMFESLTGTTRDAFVPGTPAIAGD